MVAGRASTVVPSGRVIRSPEAPLGRGRLTGVPGPDRGLRPGAPAEELPGQVRDEQREGHLEGQVRAARLKGEHGGGDPGPHAGVQQRRATRSRDDRAGPVRQGHPACLGDVDRRQVDVAQERLIGIGRADARLAETAGDLAERAGPRRRDGQDRGTGQLRRKGALEDDQVEQLGWVAAPYSAGVTA